MLSDALQALVHSVDGDTLHVETPMNGSRSVHASSVHKTPTWREEALALDDTCFQGSAVSDVAFFGTPSVVPSLSRAAYVPVNLFDDGGHQVVDFDKTPEPLAFVSKSAFKSKEENELDYAPGLFVPAKVNEMKKLFRF